MKACELSEVTIKLGLARPLTLVDTVASYMCSILLLLLCVYIIFSRLFILPHILYCITASLAS